MTIDADGVLDLAGGTANSADSVTNSGIMETQQPLTLTTTYVQNSGGILDLTFTSSPYGEILAGGNITLAGTLDVTNSSGPTSGVYPLLTSTSGTVSGTFTTFTPTGFGTTPSIAYAPQEVSLYF